MATSPEKPTNQPTDQTEADYQAEQVVEKRLIGDVEVTISTQSIESTDEDNHAFTKEEGLYGVAIGEHSFSSIEPPSRGQLQSMAARDVAAFIKEAIQGKSDDFAPPATVLEASDGFAWVATDEADNTGILQVKLDKESNQLTYKRLGAKGSPKSGVVRPEAGSELILSDNKTLDSLSQSGDNPADYEAAKQEALDGQRDVPMISLKPSDKLVKSMHDAHGGSRRRKNQSQKTPAIPAVEAEPEAYDPRPVGNAGITAPPAAETDKSSKPSIEEVFSAQGLEDLRRAQSAAMSDYVLRNYSRGITKAKQEFIASQLADFNQDYLASVGVYPDNPNYEAAFATLEKANITADYQVEQAVDRRAGASLVAEAAPESEPESVEESPVETQVESSVYVKPALTNAEQAKAEALTEEQQILEAKQALEYQERDDSSAETDEQESDGEKDQGRLGRIKSFIGSMRQKAGFASLSVYNTATGVFGSLGKHLTARREGELQDSYEHRSKVRGVVVATAVGALALAAVSRLSGDTGEGFFGIGDGGAMEESPEADSGQEFPAPEQEVPAGDHDDAGGDESSATGSPEVSPEEIKFPEAAYEIDRGEGFYKTFQDMGIPQREWAATLEQVGPELSQNGWAYKMPNGEWGIPRPGRFPESVLQLIQDSRK